jgi:arylsulfatase A-like enzyme
MRIKRGQKVELSAYDAEYLEKLYLGEIAYLDEQVARLVEFVKQNAGAPTLFIITSDHGEEFMEHHIVGHIYNLHDTLLHVPLIFFGAGIKSGVRIKNCVSTADITPTLLDMLGLEPPQNSWGISLKRLLEGGTIEERTIFSERADFWQNSYAVIVGNWKLIFFPSKKSYMLFDIANDEGEYRNLFGKGQISEEVLLTKLNEILNWIAKHKLPPTAPDRERLKEHRKRLKALGYLGN